MADLFEDMEKPFLPMLISNWIFGIGIIEYPIGKQRRILSFIYTSIILICYGCLVYISYPHILITQISKKRPLNEKMYYFANVVITVSIIVSGWFQSNGLRKGMLKAARANDLMQKIGIPKNHSQILKNELTKLIGFLFFILFIILTNALITFSTIPPTNELILSTIVQNYPLIIGFVADSSFMNILGYAYFKFYRLNELLQSLLTSTQDEPLHRKIAKQAFYEKVYPQTYVSQANSKDYTFLIRNVKLAHLQLIKLCREANNTYGFHILLSVIVAFVMIINNVFYIYLALGNTLNDVPARKTIARGINWLIYFTVKTLAESWLCTTVYNTSIKTGDLICELYDEPFITEDTKAEIRYFNIELVQNKLEFSAYGIVRIDLNLISMMISTIGTYVIILIQFQQIQFQASLDEHDEFSSKNESLFEMLT